MSDISNADESWEVLPQRLRGRGDWLLERGRIKDAELTFDAATEIEILRTANEALAEQAKKDRSLIDAGIKLCEIKGRRAEALAGRVEQIESTVDKFINGITDSICVSGNDAGTNIWYVRRLKSEILPTDDTAASILAERDARTLRMAADRCRIIHRLGGGAAECVELLIETADELSKAGATEKQSCQ